MAARTTRCCLSSRLRKNILVLTSPKSLHNPRRLVPSKRGGSRSSRTLGTGCGGRGRALDETCGCGRLSRVVLTPRRWRQVATMLAHCAYDGDKKARSPGRARRKPLKPLRRECRVISAEPVVSNSCAYFFAHEAAGAASTRHSLRPLFFGAHIFTYHSGAKRAAGMNLSCPDLIRASIIFATSFFEEDGSPGQAR
jgi:hypothetical protein